MDHPVQLLAVERREACRLRFVGELGLGRLPPAGHGGGSAYLAQACRSAGSSGSRVMRSLQIMTAPPGPEASRSLSYRKLLLPLGGTGELRLSLRDLGILNPPEERFGVLDAVGVR